MKVLLFALNGSEAGNGVPSARSQPARRWRHARSGR